MNKYIIAQADIDWSNNRWEYKGYGFLGRPPKRKSGFIGLYDRNKNKFQWFKIIGKCVDKFAYIVERKIPIKGYWGNLTKFYA